MMRISAIIVGQNDDVYHVETRTEGVKTPCTFSIKAKSEDEAAFEAIRRTELMGEVVADSMRAN